MSNAQEWNGVSAPTMYQGIRFRSRLEARWAIFFTELGIEWEFEKEAFDTKYGYYLPDFFLPELNKWFIVKGQVLESDERKKVADVCEMTETVALIACGSIPIHFKIENGLPCYYFDLVRPDENGHETGDSYYLPCVCPKCEKIDFQYEGRHQRNCDCSEFDGGYDDISMNIIRIAARTARGAYWDQQTKQFVPGE